MGILRNPEWLALVPLLALMGWYWKRLQLHKPLRILFLLMVVLILCRPQLRLLQEGMDLFVLLDRSESTEGRVEKSLPEWKKLLESGRRSRQDRLIYVDYAADVLSQDIAAGQPFTGSKSLTKTGLALQNVMAMRDPERASRVLLFTDGFSTEPLTGISEKLQQENTPLDVRFLTEPLGDDFRVVKFITPNRVQTMEPFLVEVQVAGPESKDGPMQLTISRNGQTMTNAEVILRKGRGLARFTDRVQAAGGQKYEVQIRPSLDSHPGNNHMEAWVEVTGGPRLLLITKYENDPVATVLRQMKYEVDIVTEPQTLQAGQLSGCRAVILNNVPAFEIPGPFLASLDFFVKEQGGGLIMAGGKQSFGAGGYFHSSVDNLLPVSMELKTDQRKTAVSMAIVMDRSGSMGAPVSGGMKKMDLADEGAAKAIEMLGYMDSVAVLAVDSEAHEPITMQQIGDDGNKSTLMQICRRISVGGGGIFTYTGLKAGWNSLKSTNYGTRHLILFADAADAEEPGDYVNLLNEMTTAGATVSVIALGTKADSDAKFLEDVALRGKGRIFFTNDATELPNIFTQETVAVARSAFVTDPVKSRATGGWAEVSTKEMKWLGEIDGYNLSYKKDWASQALVSADEYAAPLISWGLRGTGRTAAISFPLGGKYSGRALGWEGYGDFLQTFGKWLMGEEVPPGLGIRQQMTGTELKLDLLFESEWESVFAATPPRIVLAEGERSDIRKELIWRRLAPGHYSVSTDLGEGKLVRGVIQAGKHMLPFGPVSVGKDAEWAFDPARVEELRQTASQSGGRELLDLQDAWVSPPAQEFSDIRHWLLIAALVFMLADALVTRMGWQLPEWTRKREKMVVSKPAFGISVVPSKNAPSPAKAAIGAATPAIASTPEKIGERAEDEAAKRSARFARAKKR